jgi:sugar transferase (PEP-CTERM system associated)
MRTEGTLEKTLEKAPKHEILGNYNEIPALCKKGHVNRIIVALDERRGNFPVEQLLLCRLKGIRVDDGMAFTEELAGKLSIENLHPSSLIFSDGFKRSFIFKKIKRCLDVILSIMGLVVSMPINVVISVAIKVDSTGPVLYKQERVGEDGKRFRLLKFRSMHQDAEPDGPVWADVSDERTTRVGKVIRQLRLDEIPQMVNVLRGEMSFVGPRPERPFFVEQLRKEIPYYFQRHTVKPGITGWAQIKYPYGASKKDALEKLKYDFYYVKHMSFFFDLMVMMETVKIVLLSRGAR